MGKVDGSLIDPFDIRLMLRVAKRRIEWATDRNH
jgi:hypothetical protein